MTHWTVDAPTALDFDDVTELNVRLIGGTVAVLASDDRPSLAVSELSGRPLQVTHSGGALTVSYDSLSWDGLLAFLKPRKDSAAVTITVPADCPIQLGVLSASAVVTGLHAGAAVKAMSGDITLDGVTGDVSAETMSGEVAGCDLDGEIRFKSMSGGLTVAGGSVDSLTVDTMSGPVTADVVLTSGAGRESLLEHDESSACADGGGWEYGSDKGHITLCGATCQRLRADDGAKIEVLMGCLPATH